MTTVVEFTTPGADTWECPVGVTTVRSAAFGAAGGSGAGGAFGGLGQGGHGGAFAEDYVDVEPGVVYNLFVGGGGTGGVAPLGAGTAGQDSWFIDSSTVMAKGGGGGAGGFGNSGAGGQASASIGAIKFSGGNGSPANGGGGGGGAGAGGPGSNAVGDVGGAGGGGDFPGAAGRTRVGASIPGVQPGGGASSGTASNDSHGAAGGHGKVVLQYDQDTIVYGPVQKIMDAPRIYLNGDPMFRAVADGDEVWRSMIEKILNHNAENLFEIVIPDRVTVMHFEARGAQGGAGAGAGAAGTPGGGAGGAGGIIIGRFGVNPGQVITAYAGRQGGAGHVDPYGSAGEPGGVCSQLNIFGHDLKQLGGAGGGFTGIWLDYEPIVIVGGGGGGGSSTSGLLGGAGGTGGGTTGGTGTAGQNSGFPLAAGTGGSGGTQLAGGAGGVGGNNSNGNGVGSAGIYLGGGSTYRLGLYGAGVTPHCCGGGGGGGYFGGGGGGNGSADGFGGAAGGGGGGSSYFNETVVAVSTNQRGTNTGHGELILTFLAPNDWTP